MNTQSAIAPKDTLHPLLIDLETYETWSDWKKDWDSETRLLRKRNLLHIGWSMIPKDKEESTERLLFYLDLADGYSHSGVFRLPGEYGGASVAAQHNGRRELAVKAFQCLCENVFKNEEGSFEVPTWASWLRDERVTRKLVWFLRPERPDEERSSLHNLYRNQERDSHLQTVFREFACKFADWTWKFPDAWAKETVGSVDRFRELMDEFEPERVELLSGLRRLFLLYDGSDYPVSERGRAKLRTLALSTEFFFGGFGPEDNNRRAASIEEACFKGSAAARTLLIVENNDNERKRLAAIARAKHDAEEAQRRLEELTK